MKVLITGVAGFMGSHLGDYLIQHKSKYKIIDILGIDNLSGGYIRNVHKNIAFTKLDLRNKEQVKKYIVSHRPNYIYHLAADATEGRSQFTPISAIENNIVAFINLVTPAIVTDELKKIVVTSSMSVYGSQRPPFSESLLRKPEDIYGIAKSAMEQSLEVLAKVYGFRYTVFRPHNVYGPKQNIADPYRNVIGIFINALLNNKHFYIYGDGSQKRAFTYIDDFTPYFARAMFEDKTDGEIINIGPREEYSINEVANEVLSSFGYKDNVPEHLKPRFVDLRPQEVIEAFCTNNKAESLLGYNTTVTLSEGITRMVEWAKKIGPQKCRYLNSLEIESSKTPVVWTKKLY